jgi:CP family cyanate transporter-like MFS transporter
MNLETENTMTSDPGNTAQPKRTAELEELLIDAEADDEQVQQIRYCAGHGCCCWA